MFKKRFTAVAILTLLCTTAHAEETKLTNENDKFSYSLGLFIGERVIKEYGEINYDLLFEAIKAQHSGSETALSLQQAGEILQARQQAQAAERSNGAREAGRKYLADNALRKEVTVTETGLQYEVLTDAEGPKPKASDTVSVHYRGTLLNGTEFDSSYARNEPASFPLNRVIPGWTEGVQLMSVGSKYRFVIPSELAYGERGAGQNIGPGETLVFEVELLDIDAAQ